MWFLVYALFSVLISSRYAEFQIGDFTHRHTHRAKIHLVMNFISRRILSLCSLDNVRHNIDSLSGSKHGLLKCDYISISSKY